jgi:S1-C subfamily serine protease
VQDQESVSKIVISTSEVDSVALPVDIVQSPKVPAAIPVWARLVMLPLVLVLPILAIVALVMRIALRATPPRTQQAWHSYLLALMVAGSFVFTITAVLTFSYIPTPPQAISVGLAELDERAKFPALPSSTQMAGTDIAHEMKPLVMVASPAARRWFSGSEMNSNYIGAAVLLHADADGYLFATARHVAEVPGSAAKPSHRVLLTTGGADWAGADIVGWQREADLALLWLPRHGGHAEFTQPLARVQDDEPGVPIYAIGHPEGLNFTISNGIISRIMGDTIQISAPVSPGNSGGPVYDNRGDLVGIVIAKLDRTVDPNAENLNFAASSDLLASTNGWQFDGNGQKRLTDYINALKQISTPGKTN